MPNDVTTEAEQDKAATETTTQPAAGTPETTQTQAANTGDKAFTQADVDRIVKERLERERKASTEAAKVAAERAKMEEGERLKAEKADLEKKLADAEAARVAAERMAALTGKVADPKAALKLVEADHLDSDGAVNVDALLKAYPFLKPQTPASVGGGNPPSGGADKQKPARLLDALERDARGR